ncbi:MAG: sodium:solute symporter family protein [Candidatus Bathyarchaeia archaeon]
MIEATWIYLAIIIWFVAGCIVSHLARRRMGRGVSEYFIANRKLGGFISAMTYSATTYSAFMMVGLVGLTYSTGVASLGFELTYLIGTGMLLILFAPRFWLAGKRYQYITPAQLLSGRYENPLVGAVTTALCLVMLVPYASVQFMGIGYLVESLSGGTITYMVGCLIVAGVTLIYAWWAGMRSVAWTDAVQAVIMLATSLFLLLFIIFTFFGGFGDFIVNVESSIPSHLTVKWPFTLFLGLSLPWFFFAVTNPQVTQRLFIPTNVRSLKTMVRGFLIFGFIYTIIVTLFGLAAKIVEPNLKIADMAMPILLSRTPTLVALLAFVGIVVAATSTLNSIVLTLSSMCSRDIYRTINPLSSEEKELLVGKVVIPLMTVACFVFAQLRLELIAVLSSMASAGLLMQLPAVVGAFFWKRGTAVGALSSIAIGGIIVGGMLIAGWYPLGHWPGVWGLAASSLIFVGVSLLTEPPKRAEEFLRNINEALKTHNM